MENRKQRAVLLFTEEVNRQFSTGYAGEHGYRPALVELIQSFDDVSATNDPRRTEHGNPDIVIYKTSNTDVILGRGEAKDITVLDLDKTAKSEQLQRYAGYEKLFLTNGLEFVFYQNGEEYERVKIGNLRAGIINFDSTQFERLMNEMYAFLSLKPESIKSGKRLSIIMGGKAQRIKDNVNYYLGRENEKNAELLKIYDMMRELLVHDLTVEKFADMYAQTLVYGLFIARYGDSTPNDFSRSEARELIPKSNPFLRHFFDHIVGPDFDSRLAHIVDELCQVFSVSDVEQIVHKHLRIADETVDAKDPIIHFYEDFLKEYDPEERKKMGAYYTPIPVVKFIVKQVDRILKEEFGITKGLASDETFRKIVDLGQEVDTIKTQSTGRQVKTKTRLVEKDFYRVQVLDPAVGTATFLNETIKYIHEEFKGQEGRWPAYVKDNLVKRLFGFELMMAPYTIAHLKLGMTLRETGVSALEDRLNILLTNTLEEGVPAQQDLFSFGLAQAVSEESRHAAEVKSESPVMIVMGNPPYSGASSNETKYANSLISKYKVEPGGLRKLQEKKHWLNDDYVKFIAFAEDMIAKNGSGVVAMITNNGYLDNPTFRGMRWQLAKTFDKIYVLDLHGNSKKKEVALDGRKDENVFDIMQGVGIILAIKTNSKPLELAEVYHSEIYGTRKHKFERMLEGDFTWQKLLITNDSTFFVPRNHDGEEGYNEFISIVDLMPLNSTGIVTAIDRLSIFITAEELKSKTYEILNSKDPYHEFDIKDGRRVPKEERIRELREVSQSEPTKIAFRPFDQRWMYYTKRPEVWMNSPRTEFMKNLIHGNNVALVVARQCVGDWRYAFVADSIGDFNLTASAGRLGAGNYFPLYVMHEDGTKTPNFDKTQLTLFTRNLSGSPSPEEVLSYVYAVLYSPKYRKKYNEFLKSDFPRIPVPVSNKEFEHFVRYGDELRELHLMRSRSLHNSTITYPILGANTVESISYADDRVWINESQYFGNVTEAAWNGYIGGYQPAQKWLKDRKGRELSNADLEHYQSIIQILTETDRIMNEVDLE